jgi:hypothetical protein
MSPRYCSLATSDFKHVCVSCGCEAGRCGCSGEKATQLGPEEAAGEIDPVADHRHEVTPGVFTSGIIRDPGGGHHHEFPIGVSTGPAISGKRVFSTFFQRFVSVECRKRAGWRT